MLISVLIAIVFSQALLWPQPKKSSISKYQKTIQPCSIQYIISSSPIQLLQIRNFYLANVFKCKIKENNEKEIKAIFTLSNSTIIPPLDQSQDYKIKFDGTQFLISSSYYPGYVRAWQTFSQLFIFDEDSEIWMINYPIQIEDKPDFFWRGLLMDTSRHYISIDNIKKTIDALMYNKMNVLHWHIIDSESFPMEVESHPQLSKNGSYSADQIYNKTVIQNIIKYATTRAVRIIPQINTPAHTLSWSLSQQNKDISINCNGLYFGQFDPSLDKVYNLVDDVMKYVNDLFPDQIIHFGGDQVDYNCWDKRPQIKDFMIKNNLNTYRDLQQYYRKRQKQLFRSFSNKQIIYWSDSNSLIPQSDILQWWQFSNDSQKIISLKNPLILSYADLTYLDKGFGGTFGNPYQTYQTWRQIYEIDTKIQGFEGIIMGAQVNLWSQIVNNEVIFTKSWIRASILGERFWNSQVQLNYANIVSRLAEQSTRMKLRGINISAASSQFCMRNSQQCFAQKKKRVIYQQQ